MIVTYHCPTKDCDMDASGFQLDFDPGDVIRDRPTLEILCQCGNKHFFELVDNELIETLTWKEHNEQ